MILHNELKELTNLSSFSFVEKVNDDTVSVDLAAAVLVCDNHVVAVVIVVVDDNNDDALAI